MEYYKNPRLLKCGHQFCEVCLSHILKQSPKGEIICPTCRDVTKPKLGDVTTLPRSTLHQYIQELIFQLPQKEVLGKTCTKCKAKIPTRHCSDCKDLSYMCDGCFVNHEKIPSFAKHETVPFDPLLVCAEHPHKMVECFCHDCKKMVCPECIFEIHDGHNIENMKEAAETAKKSLRKYTKQLGKRKVQTGVVKTLQAASGKLLNAKEKYKEKSEKALSALAMLEKKIRSNIKKMDQSVEKDLGELGKYEREIMEVSADQKKMIKLAESLLGDVSDSQVIMGAKNLPKPDLDCDEVDVNFPNIESGLDHIIHGIDAMTNAAKNSTKQETYSVQRGERQWEMKELTTIGNIGEITGVTFRNKPTQLVVRNVMNRTVMNRTTIKRYSLDGNLIKETQLNTHRAKNILFHQITPTISTIAIDSRRDLYLLPCDNGILVRAGLDRKVTDTTKLRRKRGRALDGVAYIPDYDLYVLSEYDDEKGRVFLVSPDTLTKVRSLKGPFSSPRNVCVGYINGVTTIVVSDYASDKLFLYTVDGKLIKTYGPNTTSGLRDLLGPRGVTVTKDGHIVVCNHGIQCVYRVWSDYDGDHWECVLDTRDVGWRPWDVAIDNNTRVMAVTYYEEDPNPSIGLKYDSDSDNDSSEDYSDDDDSDNGFIKLYTL